MEDKTLFVSKIMTALNKKKFRLGNLPFSAADFLWRNQRETRKNPETCSPKCASETFIFESKIVSFPIICDCLVQGHFKDVQKGLSEVMYDK